MHVCNETADDVHYTVGDPCDSKKLHSGRYREDQRLEAGKVVEFELDANTVVKSSSLPTGSVIVSLQGEKPNYNVAVLIEDCV